jgi:hypothetical protein
MKSDLVILNELAFQTAGRAVLTCFSAISAVQNIVWELKLDTWTLVREYGIIDRIITVENDKFNDTCHAYKKQDMTSTEPLAVP